MASFLKRGDRWRVLIRPAGKKSMSKTFDRLTDAKAWAREIEGQVDKTGGSAFNQLKALRLVDLMQRFADEVSPKRKGWRWEIVRLKALRREDWAQLTLADDISDALRVWRDRRLAGSPGCKPVKASTVNRDLNLLGGMFSYAMKEWNLKLTINPAHRVQRPPEKGGERDVIWSKEDLSLFLKHLRFDEDRAPVSATDFVGWVLLLARHTGLRLGNICEIRVRREGNFPWLDLTTPAVHYEAEHTKNGMRYSCPLSSTAAAIVAKLAAHRATAPSNKLIEPGKAVVGTLFRREKDRWAKGRPHAAGLRIHDLRHTWTTEMVPRISAKGGDAMLMARISGRTGTKSLFRYFNPRAEDMAKYLD